MLLIILTNMASFLISSIVSGLFDQMQTFRLSYLIEFPGRLVGLRPFKLCCHLIYLRLSAECGFFINRNTIEFQVGYLVIILSFLSKRRLWLVLDVKFSKDYPISAVVLEGSTLSPTISVLYINDLPDDIICNNGICADYADDATLYC